ncbi:MAG: hypothetical protein HUU28_08370 [Planctomycetaceae bacterium]|nr:hypothetical protein [Planctomycetaceae bacterium]
MTKTPAWRRLAVLLLIGAVATVAFLRWRTLATAPSGAELERHVRSAADVGIAVIGAPKEAPAAEFDGLETEARREPDAKLVLPSGFEWQGSFLFENRAGVVSPVEQGSFKLVFRRERGDARGIDVQCVNGSWNCTLDEMPTGLEILQIEDARVGERACDVVSPRRIASESVGEPLEVIVRWPIKSLLHVLDDETGEPLQSILVAESSGRFLPSERQVLHGRPLASPLTLNDLPLRRGPQDIWVSAPGYAWGQLAVDIGDGTTKSVRLKRSGQLIATFTNVPEREKGTLVIQVRTADPLRNRTSFGQLPEEEITGILNAWEEIVAEFQLQPANATFTTTLLPGFYRVEAAFHQAGGAGSQVLASDYVTVSAGTPTNVSLRLKPPTLEGVCAVSGRIHVPSGMKRARAVTLRSRRTGKDVGALRPALSMVSEDIRGRVYEWGPEALCWGEFQIHVDGVEYLTTFTVPEIAEHILELNIPRATEFLLRFVDAASGAIVEPTDVSWIPALASDVTHTGTSQTVSLDTARGGYPVSCAAEVICVFAGDLRSLGYELASEDKLIVVSPGVRDIPVRRFTAVRVELRERGEIRSIPSGFWFSVLDAEGNYVNGASWSDTLFEGHELSAAGSYHLEFESIDGYEEIGPLVVDVADGEIKTVTIDLVRKP